MSVRSEKNQEKEILRDREKVTKKETSNKGTQRTVKKSLERALKDLT